MRLKLVTSIVLIFLISGLFTPLLIETVEAGPTEYHVIINADGSIQSVPLGVPITTTDSLTYTLTDSFYGYIQIKRSNIVFEGQDYTITSPHLNSLVFVLMDVNNATIRNIHAIDGIVQFSNTSDSSLTSSTIQYVTDCVCWSFSVCSGSNNNTIANNAITGVYGGIRVTGSSFTNVINNTILSSTSSTMGYALYFGDDSNNNTISYNTVADCARGIELGYASNNTINNNLFDNASQSVYLMAESGECKYNQITNNTLINAGQAIYIGQISGVASYNVVSGNNLTGCNAGITVVEVCENTIAFNTITGGAYSVCIYNAGTCNNVIYQNNFLSNSVKAVNYDEDSGENVWSVNGKGNYYSDYLTQNPTAQEANGIWTLPYNVSSIYQDEYPLAHPMGLYVLNITVTGCGTTSPSSGLNFASFNEQVEVTATADTDKNFRYWLLDGENTTVNPLTVRMGTDHTLEAFFDLDTRNVTIAPAANGMVVDASGNRVDGTSVKLEVNSEYTLTAIPDEGYGLVWWTVTDTSSWTSPYNPLELTVNVNYDVTATFGASHTLTVENSAHGKIYNWSYTDISGLTVPTVNSTIYPLFAVADEGYAFSYWLLDGEEYSSENWLELTIDGDHTIEAVFTMQPLYIYEQGSDWPTFMQNNQHTIQTSSAGPTTNETLWTYELLEDLGFGTPVVADNVLYAPSYWGGIYAINLTTSQLIWSHFIDDAHFYGSSPTVADGVVYALTMEGYVYALNATTGLELWSFATADSDPFGYTSSPTIENGVLYANGAFGIIYALNLSATDESQRLLWCYSTEKTMLSPPVISGNVLYSVTQEGCIYAIDVVSGEKLWNNTLVDTIAAAPVLSNDVLYISTANGYIIALDVTNNGAIIWSYLISDTISSSPIISNDVLYSLSDSGYIYALDATPSGASGDLLWSCNTEKGVNGLCTPAKANDILYFIANHGEIYAFNLTSQQVLWIYETNCTFAFSSPIIANGVLYALSSYDADYNGQIFAFSTSSKVNFVQTGLPTGAKWYATLDGVTQISTGDSAAYIMCPNGEFNYEIYANGYTSNDTNGVITLTGDDVTKSISFTEIRTIIATKTTNNQTYTIEITSGNISASQFSNMTITPYASNTTTVVEFTLTGQSGTNGTSTIAIPKEAIPYGTIPKVYIDGVLAENQTYTEDSTNYYITFSTHFSTHDIDITFEATQSTATKAQTSSGQMTTTEHPDSTATPTPTPTITPTPTPTTNPTTQPTTTPAQTPVDYGIWIYLALVIAAFVMFFIIAGYVRKKRNEF